MNLKITLTFSEPLLDKIIEEIMANFPEASHGNALRCDRFNYKENLYTFVDGETGKVYKLNKAKLRAAIPLMYTYKWPKGLTQPPASDRLEMWEEWFNQADAGDFDAFVQLACFGKVIYG